MSSRPWFRFYVEAVFDRKLRRLTPAQRWLWVVVLAAARKSPLAGFLMLSEQEPLVADDLADMAGMSVSQVIAALPLFESAGMTAWDENLGTWHVVKWDERQYESDVSTTRVKRYRERKRNVSVTPPESESYPDSDTDTSRLSVVPVVTAVENDGDCIKQRMVGLCEMVGVASDDAKRCIDRLRLEDIGDITLDEVIGFTMQRHAGELGPVRNPVGYVEKLARDWHRQRMGIA